MQSNKKLGDASGLRKNHVLRVQEIQIYGAVHGAYAVEKERNNKIKGTIMQQHNELNKER